ncbi:hypothetical protein [Yinghuangia soli]|uniref:Uncharacterized protein n=1 Tax=Yinghuangia soli TaxID=2908204 RepID=A0AA41TZS4_9ACTN|nr:hypothetical protein [Yinghuangia soli]MCF2527610.1 hypothetical protein [Yinghuangia soli]
MRFGFRRAAVLAVAVFFGSMASLYVPAARASQLPRVPRVPDPFLPAYFALPFPGPLWTVSGTASFG